jgi:hypothetical protein
MKVLAMTSFPGGAPARPCLNGPGYPLSTRASLAHPGGPIPSSAIRS